MRSFAMLKTLVIAVLVAFTIASPLVARTGSTNGKLRPVALVQRDGTVISDLAPRIAQLTGDYSKDASANSTTGSTSSSSSPLGSAAGAQSGSDGSATSSTSSCQFLGGCTSGASSACPIGDNVDQTEQSSVCGSSTSTSSSGFLGVGGLLSGLSGLGGGGGSSGSSRR